MFMMSSGGLTAANLFRGKDAILSGPAAGVVESRWCRVPERLTAVRPEAARRYST